MTSYIGASPETTISRVRYLYTAVTAQDTFTTATDGQVLSYESTNNVDVYVNGVLLTPTTDYAAETGSSIVLVDAAVADDKVEVLTYESFQVANYLPTTGGTVTGDLTVGKGDGTADARIQFNSDSTQGTAWIGIPTWADDHLYLFGPNAAGGNEAVMDYDGANEITRFYTGNTERLRIESDGDLQHQSKPAYFARAWVNFNGTGTVSVRASGNVSSITDYGEGYYGVNFSTAMADADYAAVAMGKPTTSSYGQSFTTNTHQSHTQTSSQVRIVNSYQDDNNNAVWYKDSAYMFLAVFR